MNPAYPNILWSQPTYPAMERDSQFIDRRKKPRIDCKYPAVVEFTSEENLADKNAEVVNLSANGLQLNANRSFDNGTPLFIKMRLSNRPAGEFSGPEIAMNCTVVWSKPRPDGKCETGLKIDRYRFL